MFINVCAVATSLTVAQKSTIQFISHKFSDSKGLEAIEYLDMTNTIMFGLAALPTLPPAYSVYL